MVATIAWEWVEIDGESQEEGLARVSLLRGIPEEQIEAYLPKDAVDIARARITELKEQGII